MRLSLEYEGEAAASECGPFVEWCSNGKLRQVTRAK